MTARGLKDTSSRPAKDLGGTLRRTLRTTLRSYDLSLYTHLDVYKRQAYEDGEIVPELAEEWGWDETKYCPYL